MKKLMFTIAIILTSILTTTAQEKTFNLTVNISGLDSDNGKVMIALYDGEAQFLNKRFKSAMIKSNNKKVTYTFKDVPKGEYAVSFFHDENNNNKMDTNFIGIPKEDYGCSNNATGFMGPPQYEDAKFLLEENKSIDIKI